MQALIFPNDSIKECIKKGEIVERYYNPNNIFSNVHIVTLGDSDVKPEESNSLVGTANLYIQAIGKISFLRILFYESYMNKILRNIQIKDIDIIIAHNSNVAGFLATKIGRKFNIPVLIYMHINPDKDIRTHISWRELKRKIFWLYSSFFLEGYTLKHASKIICAYNFIVGYLISRGVHPDKIEVIYHRIDVNRFKKEEPKDPLRNNALKILCVGRIFKHKNPENIIRAIKKLNVTLMLIGNGAYFEKTIKLADEIGVSDRVKFISSVPNIEIDQYYKAADVFVCVNDYGGVSKVIMEAMAASLPIVMKRPLWEKTPELIGDLAILTDGSAYGLEKSLRYLVDNPNKILELGKIGFEKIRGISGNIMEKREADTLISILYKNKNCKRTEGSFNYSRPNPKKI